MVVEDDEDAARTLTTLIGREHHSVTSARSLHAARRLLALQSPDLLLLDLHLPDGSGYFSTQAEVWFVSEEAAERAGFVRAQE